MMLLWSKDILLCTDGEPLSDEERRDMDARGIQVIDHPIVALQGRDRSLAAIEFENGECISRLALFFSTGCHPASDLWRQLGCECDANGSVRCDPSTCGTSVDGVFVAGDASRDLLQVAAAMGEGVRAAVAINKKMLREDGLCE
jgi:thioredoxin reductase